VPETSRAVVSSNPSAFGSTSSDRQMSLSERKTALMESARRRYIDKHRLASSLSSWFFHDGCWRSVFKNL